MKGNLHWLMLKQTFSSILYPRHTKYEGEVYRGYLIFFFQCKIEFYFTEWTPKAVFSRVAVATSFGVHVWNKVRSYTKKSGTIKPRILKFGTNVGYDLLYCAKETQPPAYLFLYLSIFLPLPLNFQSLISRLAPILTVFKFCIPLESGQVYCGKENDAEIICAFFSLVWKRINRLLLIIPFICPFFFFSSQFFCHLFLGSYENQSLQILYTHWEWPSILWERTTRCWDLFLPSFSFSFFFFHLSPM